MNRTTTLFKICLLALACLSWRDPARAQTTLAQGDISIIGFNSWLTSNFNFVLWTPVSSGTTIKFTNSNYGSAGTSNQAGIFRNEQETIIWTSTSALPAGTVVSINLGTPSTGSATVVNANMTAATQLAFSIGGDQIFAYQGAGGGSISSPTATFSGTLLFGLGFQGIVFGNTGWVTTGTAALNSSYLPADLASPNHIFLGGQAASAQYTGARTGLASAAAYKSAIANPANWTIAGGFPLPPMAITLNMASFAVSAPPAITAQPANNAICAGANTSFSVTATNATSYQWQADAGAGFANVSNGGFYSGATTPTLNITSAASSLNGVTFRCIASGAASPAATSNAASLSVTNMQAGYSQTNLACFGGTTGSIAVYPTGGTTPYTYAWTPSVSTSSTVTGLSAGAYSVTVTDAKGCTLGRNFLLSQPNQLTASQTQSNVTTPGGSNGSASVSVSGGMPYYTYSWAPSGGTAATATGLSAGSYTVTITDGYGCQITRSFTITQPVALGLTAAQTNVSCNGGSNGTANISVSGGAAPYSYSWSPSGGTSATATGLPAGNYIVTVTDNNGVTGTKSYTITQPSALTATSSSSAVSCNGGSNGAAAVSVTGGVSPYTYSWSPSGGTSATATGLSAGFYTVTITDMNACEIKKNFTITQPSAISLSNSAQSNVSCKGGSNGSATVVPAGGYPPYSYSWSPSGGTSATATGLVAGAYTVTVTDNNSCQSTRSFTITEPAALSASIASQSNVSCNGGSNGTLVAAPSGGKAPYAYTWSPFGGTAATATGLSAGSYTVTITDDNGCTATKTVALTQPSGLSVTTSQTNVACNNGSNGSASVHVSGGTTPYSYAWSPAGGTSATATGLPAGTYTATVTDGNGCTATRSFMITQPSAMTATASQTDVSCFGGANGTASLNVSGGFAPYAYYWHSGNATTTMSTSLPAGTPTATGLTAGTHAVVVTDANGCSLSRNFVITEPALLTATGTQTNVSCNGFSDASATVTVAGGTGPYTYAWSPAGGSAATASGLIAGAYTATVTDDNGCTTTRSFTITEPAPVQVYHVTGGGAYCAGGTGMTIGLDQSEQGVNYQLYLDNVATGMPVAGTGAALSFGPQTAAGTYTVSATHTSTHCDMPMTGSAVIHINPIPDVQASASQVVCNGAATGHVSFTGAVKGTAYSWTNTDPSIGLDASGGGDIASFTATNTTSVPRTATITVTPSAAGCTGAPATVSVTVNPTPDVQPVLNRVVCNTATINTVAFNGAVAGTSYAWTNSNTQIGLAASGTGSIAAFPAQNAGASTDTAIIIVTPSANGCAGASESFMLAVHPTPIVQAVTAQTICNTASTSPVTLSSAVTGTDFAWTNSEPSIGLAASGRGSIPSFATINTGTSPIVSTVNVTPSSNGCTGPVLSFNLTVNPTPTVHASPDQVVCNGVTTAAVAFSGDVAGTSFSWTAHNPGIGLAAGSGSGTLPAFTGINSWTIPNMTRIVVTPAANGCTGATDTFRIEVNPTPRVHPESNQVLCNNAGTALIQFSGSVLNAVYSWTNTDTTIGLAASGTGTIMPFRALNASAAPVRAMISVTPTAYGCVGATDTLTFTVNPTPQLSGTLTPAAVCNRSLFSYMPASATAGTTFDWSRTTTAGILNMANTGTDNPLETLTNTTANPVDVVYNYMLTANNCVNYQDVKVSINPTPKLSSSYAPPAICNSTRFSYAPASATTGTAFAWSRPSVTGISTLPASGTGSVSEVLTNTTDEPVTVAYTYTLTANGCSNTETVSVVVNPTPVLDGELNATICSGESFSYTPGSKTSGTAFAWSRASVEGISEAAGNGAGSISERLTNTTPAAIDVAYLYTLSANGCQDTQHVIVHVLPAPKMPVIATHPSEGLCAGTMYQAFGAAEAAQPGATYAWSVTNAALYAQGNDKRNATVNFPNAGTSVITLTATITETGCTSRTSYTVQVGAGTAATPTVIYRNNSFVCLQRDMDSYRWGYDERASLDEVTLNEKGQDYHNAAPDFSNRLYWVMTTKNGCTQKTYYRGSAGIGSASSEALSIEAYPNPATELVHVRLTAGTGADLQIGVHDISGRLVMTGSFSMGKAQLAVSDLAPGAYTITVNRGGLKLATTRFIKN